MNELLVHMIGSRLPPAGARALHEEIEQAFKEHASEARMAALMARCTQFECAACAWIVCPWHDPLHFHHDGCPSCSPIKVAE
jgi:hypothetical protein